MNFCCQRSPNCKRSRRFIQKSRTFPEESVALNPKPIFRRLVEQGEWSIREFVNLVEIFRDKNILLVKLRVDYQAAFVFSRNGDEILIAHRIDATRDANTAMRHPSQPQGTHQAHQLGKHRRQMLQHGRDVVRSHGKQGAVMLLPVGSGPCLVQIDNAGVQAGMQRVVHFRFRFVRLTVYPRLGNEDDLVGTESDGEAFALDAFRAVRQGTAVHEIIFAQKSTTTVRSRAKPPARWRNDKMYSEKDERGTGR